jgi:hypothetical protein
MESIMQKEKYCLVCGTTHNLHSHHIFFGTANRKQSEKYGLKVWLCGYHHNMSNDGVHFNKHLDSQLKQMGQRHFEARYGNREEFIKVFGKSYL